MVDIDRVPRGDIEAFTSSLVNHTTQRIQGTHISDGERVPAGKTPRTAFFSGVLTPEEEEPTISKEVQSRTSPSTLGLIGRITDTGDRETVSLEIRLSFAVYYRVIPTPSDKEQTDEVNPTVYRKCRIGVPDSSDDEDSTGVVSTSLTFDALTEYTGKLRGVSAQVEKELNQQISTAIKEQIADAADLYGGDPKQVGRFLTERDDLDDDTYLEEVAKSGLGGDHEYVPDIDLGVDIRLLEGLDETAATVEKPGTALVRVDITNESDEEHDFGDVDLATYETQLEIRENIGSNIEQVIFEDVPEGFRYDQSVPGQGHNCTAEWSSDKKGIKSVTVPVYKQPQFNHRNFAEVFGPEADPRFDTLAENPLPVLRKIRQILKSYKNNEWNDRLEEAKTEADNPDENSKVQAIKDDIERFQQEIERYDRGVALLEDDGTARELFKQVNRVFLRKVRQGDPWDEGADLEYPGWRPFQLVFIVSLLPDIVYEERDFDEEDHDREIADILYFPTGGGKTEAYLALLVFTALFDRDRGKNFGVSSMMRFPLRLLTLQQFQRVVEILTHANEIRKKAGYGGDPLSAGFFTGNTENQLKSILETEFEGWYPSYPQDRETLETNRAKVREFAKRWNQTDGHDLEHINRDDYRTVEQCPLCGSDIELVFNTETDRIEHHCSASEEVCDREKLNVHVTDSDIYRAVPTIVVGTQDKLAALGYNYRFRTLAGYVTHYCPEHGYTHAADECQLTRFCGRDDERTRSEDDGGLKSVDAYDTAPTLTLQDELHLVNEDLGTFESHYYAAYEKHMEWAAEKQGLKYYEPKKIAATATIEESDNQVKHLYGGADAIRFPAPGPDYRDSAYTTTDDAHTQRYYIGVTPWNRSQINSIIRLLEMHQRRIQDWLSDPEDKMADIDFNELSDPDTFKELLGYYYTLVTYVISKFDGGRVYKSAETQVNDNLSDDGYGTIDRFDMQGNTDPDAMADMLSRFEQFGEEGGTTHEDLEGLITATASISHGVDLDALGYMLFFNAPPRMSEYIQASSRVGRNYPGLVLDVFDPMGERDRSHYHYFNKYHEYLDRLVEPVAINRWAKFSVDRTFPGIFMSLLYIRYYDELCEELGWFSNRTHPRQARKAEQARVLNQDDIIDHLKEIYGQDWETGQCPFADRIERLVQQSFNRIAGGEEETISECLIGRVMLSLRDVDEPIDIYPGRKHEDAFKALGVDVR